MVSAISEYCTDSIVLEGKDRVKKISGKLVGGTTYYPGNTVYMSSAGVWTLTTGDQSFNNAKVQPGWIEFKKRTSKTFGEIDIDTAYTYGTAENVEIIVGPLDGTIKIAAFCKATNGTGLYGMALSVTSGGKMFALGSAWAAKVSFSQCCFLAEEGASSTDTVIKMYLTSRG